MKKTLVSVVAAGLLVGTVFAPSALAVTKTDLLEEAKKIPVSKYVIVDAENLMKKIDITDEQAEQLMPILKRCAEALPEDLGPEPSNYSSAQIQTVLDSLSEACDILDLTYNIDVKSASKNGFTLTLMDKTGEVIYTYSGVVKKTDVDGNQMAGNIALAAGALFLVAALGSYVVLRKKAVNQ